MKLLTLASGGMGTVHAVVREEGAFRRLYAMKTLRETFREDDDVREMFLAEARIAGLIRHPNVVSVLDVGATEAEGPFLIMEYVEGVTVDALIKRARDRREHIPVALAVQVAEDAVGGLHAAHETRALDGSEVQVVHRDVSPHNILLGFDGVVRVTDFGVAKVLGHLSKTDTGVLKGKMGYMSPEQLKFEPIDRRSDLFSLGVVLYEMLTLTRLYRTKDGTPAARAILYDPPPDVGELRSDLPAELVALLFTLLAKHPDKRPATAQEAGQRLRRIRTQLEDDDTPALAEYLAELFADERAARTDAIAAALSGESPGPIAADETDDPSKSATHIERRMPRRTRAWLLALSVAIVAALSLATWLVLSGTPDERVTDGAEPATQDPAAEPPEPQAPTTELPAARATSDTAAPEPEPEAEAGTSDPESRDRRIRKRARPRRGSMAEGARPLPADDIWTEFP